MKPQAGLNVTANVRLLRLLGQGGMGAVWVAEHLTLGTEVAVKFIAGEPGELDPRHVQRFRREARAAAQLRSPHVVQTFDHGVMEGGHPYIVMELLQGETLGARLEREGSLSPDVAAQVVVQTAKALAEAHEAGIVHRDIKPSNLFLAESGGELLVKVLDFGIAKLADKDDGTTKTGSLMGTLHYMSPEQLNDSSSVGPPADLWSLSVVAYHVLTGKLPFEGGTPVALWRAITEQRFAPPSASRPLSSKVDSFFECAFRESEGERFPHAKALSAAFAEAVEATSLLPTSSRDEPEGPSSGVMRELPTAEFVAQASLELDTDPDAVAPGTSEAPPEVSEPIPSTEPSAPEHLPEELLDDEVSDTFMSPAGPPSVVRRRRSMALGFGLGAGTLGLALVGIWLSGALKPPPPPQDPLSGRRGHRTAATTVVTTSPPRSTATAPLVATATATATATAHAPDRILYPIGCNKSERPCGHGCCIWHRGCEPYACDEPLPPDDPFRVTVTKVVAWPEGKPRDVHVFKDAEVFIRFGAEGHKQQLVPEGLTVSGADVGEAFSMWIQVNDNKLPEPIIDLRPTGVSKQNVVGRMLCRGIQTRIPRNGVVYSVWLAVRPEGAPKPELCGKAINPF